MTSKLQRAITAAQRVITRDEGGRGIGPLVMQEDIGRAAAALVSAKSVGIVTGFPCLITPEGKVRFDSPQETDGVRGGSLPPHRRG